MTIKKDLHKNKYDWQELKEYLEGFIAAQVRKDMEDPTFTEEMNWTEDKARVNAIENLEQSIKIIFPEIIKIKI